MEAGMIELVKDNIGEKLDELADLAEYWKKQRNEGKSPTGVRQAMLMVINEIQLYQQQDAHNLLSSQIEDQKNKIAKTCWKE